MNRTLTLVLAAIVTSLPLIASPLPAKQIAGNAKWVVHLDVEQFLKGKIGTHLLKNIIEPQVAGPRAQLQSQLGFDLDWNKIESITAYGSGYQPDQDTTGVILIRSRLDLQGALDAALTKEIPGMNVRRTGDTARPVYSLNEDAFAVFESSGTLLISKYKDALDKGSAVLRGSSPSLAGTATLSGYPDAASGFFLVALADGFSQHTDLPPTAAILKQAIGAQVVLGEIGDRLRLAVNVKTATADAARQIQQVAQGLLALASLNAGQNPDLKVLTEAASITAAGQLVTLGAEVPVSAVIQRMTQ
jgi:hypothetical protein